jgi:PTS system fructose-specific IIC component
MDHLITPGLVTLDADLGTDRSSVIRYFAGQVAEQGRASEADGLYVDALAREEHSATGIPGGIAIPHCRSGAMLVPTIAVARLSLPVDFGAEDGPADLVFFLAGLEGAHSEHLKVLSKLARSLIRKDFTASLRAAGTGEDIVRLVEGALGVGAGDTAEAATARNDGAARGETVAGAASAAAAVVVAAGTAHPAPAGQDPSGT